MELGKLQAVAAPDVGEGHPLDDVRLHLLFVVQVVGHLGPKERQPGEGAAVANERHVLGNTRDTHSQRNIHKNKGYQMQVLVEATHTQPHPQHTATD